MPKKIHLISFIHAAASSMAYGQWKDTEDKLAREYTDPNFWVKTAQTLERGGFDAIFFADAHGVKDVYRGSYEASVKSGMQFPACDPILVAAAIARETKTIGLIVTWSAGYFPPYHTARLFSTLDHLTNGRAGWNVVTSYLSAGLKNGMGDNIPHDERYDRADEYMDVVYKLWEKSWDDDAVVLDKQTSTYADPTRVHKINHKGKYYSVEGPHQSEPSRQRTPFIVQAGGSPRGNAFAGKHAEAVFMVCMSIVDAAKSTKKLREATAAAGRDPSSVKALLQVSCIVAETEAEAQAKAAHFLELADVDGSLSLLGGHTDIDFSKFRSDQALSGLESGGITTIGKFFSGVGGSDKWTFGDMCEYLKLSYLCPTIVGTPEQVADALEKWIDEADVDGFVLAPVQTPASYEDFVDLVVPELRKRGRLNDVGEISTLRERFTGSEKIATDHHAHSVSIDGAIAGGRRARVTGRKAS